MPTTPLRRLRRYQDMLLLGGGVVVTLVAFLTFAVTCIYAVRNFMAGERQQIVEDRGRVAMAVREAETSLRRTVSYIELSWPSLQMTDGDAFDAFVKNGNRIVIPRPTMPSGVLFAADSRALDNPPLVRRYLALAQQFALSNASASLSNNVDIDGYIYSPHQELIVVPAPAMPSEEPSHVSELIESLKVDFSTLKPRVGENEAGYLQPVYWLPPFTDPLTGDVRLRLVSQARSAGEPFAVIAIEYDPRILLNTLAERGEDDTYEIAAPNGHIVARLGSDADKRRAAEASTQRKLRYPALFGGQVAYGDGYFVLSEPIADTGWTLLYAFSWRDVAEGVIARVSTAAVATAVILTAVWALLLMFRRRVFAPLLEDSLRVFESENLSRTVIHTAPVGLALVSSESGEWLLDSPLMKTMASRIVGEARALADALVVRYADFERRHPNDGTLGVLRQDFVFPAHDGGRIELAASVSHARFKGIDVLVAAFTDVTENRRLQRELSDALLAADSANQAKSAFLAAMSHEIRTPLNAILGNLELLAHSPMSNVQYDRLATVRTASDGLLTVISDILDFSKIEAGEMPLEHIEFGVLEVIERVLEIFEPVARARGIGLFARLDFAVAQTMLGDPARVGQILNNLLSNAIKFTERGRVTLFAQIERTDSGSHELCFALVDTGVGIAPEHRERLFRAFSQVDVSINRRFGGTGLGLALCQRLARAMHGRIDVSSTLDVGSRFTVHLPLGEGMTRRDDPRTLDGQRVLFLSSAQEWCDFALPHLQRWGAEVRSYRHPAAISDAELEASAVLVIWGSREQWQPDDENRLVEDASWVVDGYPEGPAHAIRAGKILSVSCLSLSGLEASMRATLLGEPLLSKSAPGAGPRTAPGTPASSLKVLVAEDNAANRLLISEQLASLGCVVQAASNGSRALEMIGDEEWDVLLTDLNMPGMSGYQLAAAARELRPTLPVMAVTAHATKEELQRCEAAGMARVMVKPLSLQTLSDAMQSIATARGLKLSRFTHADETKFRSNALPRHLREVFLKAMTEALVAIDTARAKHDVDDLLAQLHSVRGALVVFGHRELADACARMEAEIKADRSAPLPAALDGLQASLRDLVGKGE
ncbi:hybrid sensor histidine kinase/response regulator [Paraburkholderia sp. Ac-20347]|uniref:hybrid sensor histidine kinase/response regulator n=1 Tax=Paraburkholderia sp. Ac-20347 TaxID=2703892 RepID=UPI00197F3E86|nr:hybrid sensor histidine kinase/response regulator [Paraburkholderia sp. Ac-20347]MBN3812281.1 response regulator [Paraburkholderia sp. Ac-20347]